MVPLRSVLVRKPDHYLAGDWLQRICVLLGLVLNAEKWQYFLSVCSRGLVAVGEMTRYWWQGFAEVDTRGENVSRSEALVMEYLAGVLVRLSGTAPLTFLFHVGPESGLPKLLPLACVAAVLAAFLEPGRVLIHASRLVTGGSGSSGICYFADN